MASHILSGYEPVLSASLQSAYSMLQTVPGYKLCIHGLLQHECQQVGTMP